MAMCQGNTEIAELENGKGGGGVKAEIRIIAPGYTMRSSGMSRIFFPKEEEGGGSLALRP